MTAVNNDLEEHFVLDHHSTLSLYIVYAGCWYKIRDERLTRSASCDAEVLFDVQRNGSFISSVDQSYGDQQISINYNS